MCSSYSLDQFLGGIFHIVAQVPFFFAKCQRPEEGAMLTPAKSACGSIILRWESRPLSTGEVIHQLNFPWAEAFL